MGSTVTIRSKTSKTVKTKSSSETKQVQKPVEYNWGKGNVLGSK